MPPINLNRLGLLQRHCLPNMADDHKRALLLRAAGKSDLEAAAIESVSESTLKNRVAIASSEVAMGLEPGSRATADARGFWVASHLVCCLAEAAGVLGGLCA